MPHAPVLIRGGESFDLASATPIADPALDLNNPLKGPFRAETLDWRDTAEAAMEGARARRGRRHEAARAVEASSSRR